MGCAVYHQLPGVSALTTAQEGKRPPSWTWRHHICWEQTRQSDCSRGECQAGDPGEGAPQEGEVRIDQRAKFLKIQLGLKFDDCTHGSKRNKQCGLQTGRPKTLFPETWTHGELSPGQWRKCRPTRTDSLSWDEDKKLRTNPGGKSKF